MCCISERAELRYRTGLGHRHSHCYSLCFLVWSMGWDAKNLAATQSSRERQVYSSFAIGDRSDATTRRILRRRRPHYRQRTNSPIYSIVSFHHSLVHCTVQPSTSLSFHDPGEPCSGYCPPRPHQPALRTPVAATPSSTLLLRSRSCPRFGGCLTDDDLFCYTAKGCCSRPNATS